MCVDTILRIQMDTTKHATESKIWVEIRNIYFQNTRWPGFIIPGDQSNIRDKVKTELEFPL